MIYFYFLLLQLTQMLGTAVFASDEEVSHDYEIGREEAVFFYKTQKCATALEKIEEIQAENRSDYELYNLSGLCKTELKDYAGAQQSFLKALDVCDDPETRALIRLNMAETLKAQKDVAGSLQQIRKALAEAPNSEVVAKAASGTGGAGLVKKLKSSNEKSLRFSGKFAAGTTFDTNALLRAGGSENALSVSSLKGMSVPVSASARAIFSDDGGGIYETPLKISYQPYLTKELRTLSAIDLGAGFNSLWVLSGSKRVGMGLWGHGFFTNANGYQALLWETRLSPTLTFGISDSSKKRITISLPVNLGRFANDSETYSIRKSYTRFEVAADLREPTTDAIAVGAGVGAFLHETVGEQMQNYGFKASPHLAKRFWGLFDFNAQVDYRYSYFPNTTEVRSDHFISGGLDLSSRFLKNLIGESALTGVLAVAFEKNTSTQSAQTYSRTVLSLGVQYDW